MNIMGARYLVEVLDFIWLTGEESYFQNGILKLICPFTLHHTRFWFLGQPLMAYNFLHHLRNKKSDFEEMMNIHFCKMGGYGMLWRKAFVLVIGK